MGLATLTVKYILLLFNLCCSILGLVLIGFGIFILTSTSENKVDHGENLAGGLIIALGTIVLMIAVFGCFGALRESRGMVLTYVIFLVVLLLVQLILMSMASQGTNDGISGSVREGFEDLWKDEDKTPGTLAFYEDWLQCCGVNSTQDYRDIQRDIPKSCCKQHNCQIVANINDVGCLSKFEEYLAGKMVTFTIISWILVIVELIGVAFGVILLNSWKNHGRRTQSGWN